MSLSKKSDIVFFCLRQRPFQVQSPFVSHLASWIIFLMLFPLCKMIHLDGPVQQNYSIAQCTLFTSCLAFDENVQPLSRRQRFDLKALRKRRGGEKQTNFCGVSVWIPSRRRICQRVCARPHTPWHLSFFFDLEKNKFGSLEFWLRRRRRRRAWRSWPQKHKNSETLRKSLVPFQSIKNKHI